MRMMVWVITCFLVNLVLVGCGTRIYSSAQADSHKQIVADLLVLNDPSVKPSEATKAANIALANELRKALALDLDDLPRARVSLTQFKQNSEAAAKELQHASESAPVPESFSGMVGSGITVGVMLLLGVGAKLAKGTALGGPMELIQQLLTTLDPKDTHLSDALVKSIESYKASDPKWEENPLLIHLGKKLTNSQKEHIKHKAAKLT